MAKGPLLAWSHTLALRSPGTCICLWIINSVLRCSALELSLPTANDALFRVGSEAQFFQGTAGHDWVSGTYGGVRSEGHQFHEGIDVRCLTRDRRGEPTDPVFAIADGELAYLATVAGQSNYGRYALLRHNWDGVEVFSLYTHLAGFTPGLRVGQRVRRGQPIATLGYSGTQNIPKERAHLHFEICFQLNRNFARWFAPRLARGDRNDHGSFSGLNFLGIDPAAVFRAARADPAFNFRAHLETEPAAFTVLFPKWRAPLSWMRAQPWCVTSGPNPAPPTSYEVCFTAVGLPTLVRPRSDRITVTFELLRANEKALAPYRCRNLLTLDAKRRVWRLTERGGELMELLSY